jgi:amidophosphoribosyltransferase
MARIDRFIAFNAAIELLKENGKQDVIDEVYQSCKQQQNLQKEEMINYVQGIYSGFTSEQVSAKIAELLKPEDCKAEIQIVYQSIENLHKACPNDLGDWYFTGNYPTPGGNRVVNSAFTNYIEGKDQRAY